MTALLIIIGLVLIGILYSIFYWALRDYWQEIAGLHDINDSKPKEK